MSEKQKHTRILNQNEDKLVFEWHLKYKMLHLFHFDYFREKSKDYSCVSDIVCHEYTNTKWAVDLRLFGDNTGEDIQKCVVYLILVNKPSNIKKITVNQQISCKYINHTFLKNDVCFEQTNYWQPWDSPNFDAGDIHNRMDATFVMEISFQNITQIGTVILFCFLCFCLFHTISVL